MSTVPGRIELVENHLTSLNFPSAHISFDANSLETIDPFEIKDDATIFNTTVGTNEAIAALAMHYIRISTWNDKSIIRPPEQPLQSPQPATQSTQSTQSTQPTQSTQSTQATQPPQAQSTQSTQSTQPAQPAQPAQSTQPSQPAQPVQIPPHQTTGTRSQNSSFLDSINFEYRIFSIIICLLETITITIVLSLEWRKGCDRDGILAVLVSRAVSNFTLILLHLPSLHVNSGFYIPKLRKLIRFAQYVVLIYAIIELIKVKNCRRSITILTIVLGSLSIIFPALVLIVCIVSCIMCIVLVHRAEERISNWMNSTHNETAGGRTQRLDKVDELLASNTVPWTPSLIQGRLPSPNANEELSPSCFSYCLCCCYEHHDGGEKSHLFSEDQELCSICQGEFVQGSSVVILPQCRHLFDKECIQPWLKDHNTCPLCRVKVVG